MVEFKLIEIEGCQIDLMSMDSNSSKYPKDKNIVLIIPGNPGLVSYYEEFSKMIHKQLEEKFSVWTISHACHSTINNSKTELGSFYGLQKEIYLKAKFIELFVPKDSNLFLVGHSIGCYMILNALKLLQNESKKSNMLPRVSKSYFLFPTIERMKISPNGVKIWPILHYLRWLVILLTYILYIFPTWVKDIILKFKFRSYYNVNECCYVATKQLVYPRILNNVLLLAHEELRTVNELDVPLVNEFKNQITFFFGQKDGWCPLKYYYELINIIPDINAIVCGDDIEHAFVLESSKKVALTLGEHLRNDSKLY